MDQGSDTMRGKGTPKDPFLIEDMDDYNMLITHCDSNNLVYRLERDLDFSNWDDTQISRFGGFLDGNGHRIYATIKSLFHENVGQIKNLNVVDCRIQNEDYYSLGGICVMNFGTIYQCHVQGFIYGGSWVGGIAGRNTGVIQSCSVNANVSGNQYVGGVVGSHFSNWRDGIILDCHTFGRVKGIDNVGRIAGFSDGKIKDCFATGIVSGLRNVGTICGGVHKNCMISGRVPNIIIRGPGW